MLNCCNLKQNLTKLQQQILKMICFSLLKVWKYKLNFLASYETKFKNKKHLIYVICQKKMIYITLEQPLKNVIKINFIQNFRRDSWREVINHIFYLKNYSSYSNYLNRLNYVYIKIFIIVFFNKYINIQFILINTKIYNIFYNELKFIMVELPC